MTASVKVFSMHVRIDNIPYQLRQLVKADGLGHLVRGIRRLRPLVFLVLG